MTHRRRSPCCIDEAERWLAEYYRVGQDEPAQDITKAAPLDIYVRGFEDGKTAVNLDAALHEHSLEPAR